MILGLLHPVSRSLIKFTITQLLVLASDEDHSQRDCFVCVILSHGLDGRVFGIDGTVTTNQILNPFKGDRCPSLVGKPKLFFIQVFGLPLFSFCHCWEIQRMEAKNLMNSVGKQLL